LAAQWSELFEFRTAETSKLLDMSDDLVPQEVKAALPNKNRTSDKASVIFFDSRGDVKPRGVRQVSWPADDEDLMLQLIELAQLAMPALSARSAELLCKSLAVRRVYCLVLANPSDKDAQKGYAELSDSRHHHFKEIEQLRSSGEEVGEEEDNFMVVPVRLFLRPKSLQASVATCRAPQFKRLQQEVLGKDSAFLMDMDTGRVASLKGIVSYKDIYSLIAIEDDLKWVDDVLHPFLSFPDCDESFWEHMRRSMRSAPLWELVVHMVSLFCLMESVAKALVQRSLRWGAGAGALVVLVLLRSPPFLRFASGWMPGFLFAPPLLVTA